MYRDNFASDEGESRRQLGFEDDDGRNYSLDAYQELRRSSPRFHSEWCSMIYPRLRLAQMLLRDDGVIFVSIDDGEQAKLRIICDEIFGENNFVANIIWQSRTSISNDYEVSLNHNHTFIYAKRREELIFGGEPLDESEYINPDNDPRGPWKLVPLEANHTGGETVYPITNPKTGIEYYPPNGRVWVYNKRTMQRLIDDGRIKFGLKDDSSPKRKLYLQERQARGDKKTPSSLLLDAGTTQTGTNEIMSLFDGKKVFNYPKPVEFLRRLITYGAPNPDSIILDFFAGSSTTAHAVMSLNAQDSANRKFIMIQFPEPCTPKSEATKAGYATIAQIGRERIKRAGQILLCDNQQLTTNNYTIDIGFRAFRADSSNFRDVFRFPDNLTQSDLADMADNIKHDRSDLDLLFMCVTDYGLPLSLPYMAESFGEFTIHIYGDNDIVACFGENISEDAVRHIALMKTKRAIFRDSCFDSVKSRINLEQVFRAYSDASNITIL